MLDFQGFDFYKYMASNTENPRDRMKRIFASSMDSDPLNRSGLNIIPTDISVESTKTTLSPQIQKRTKASMRKLSNDQSEALNLPKSESPLITSALRVKEDGSQEIVHILRTAEGSIFELDPENSLLQELQIAAAGAAVDAFEAQTPIQTATAIKNAIQKYDDRGIVFNGSPFQAWEFAIKALERMRDFQKIQLEVIQLNALQAATRQLQSDQSLPLHKWLLLPPHRKESSMLLTEMGLAAAMEKFISSDTTQAAQNMKDISLSLSERRKDLAEMWVNSFKDTTLGIVSGTGDTVISLFGALISKAGESGTELSKALLTVVFGQDLADEGAVKAILEKSGDTGTKILELVEKSGLSLNQFLKNLLNRSKDETKTASKNKKY